MVSPDDRSSAGGTSTDPVLTDPASTDDACLQCGSDLRDRGDYLECERCGHLEYP